MKVKVKFDLASIKRWLFEHGEKLAFGIMVVVFLLFTYSAAQREVLDDTKQPDKLKAKAESVTRHVAEAQWDPKNPDAQIVDYQSRTKRDEIQITNYTLNGTLNNPIADPKGKREIPEIFNAEQLVVSGGMAPFALKSQAAEPAGNAANAANKGPRAAGSGGRGFTPSASSKLKPQPWAVITALVPVEKQVVEYSRVFARAQGENPERDHPHYADVRVERAEVVDNSVDKLDWKPLGSFAALEQTWEGTAPEYVDPRYIELNLVDPLGPRVGEEWDESVSHPKIEHALAEDPTAAPLPQAAAAAGGDDDLPGAPAAAAPPVRRRAIEAAPVAADSGPKAPAAPPKITHKLLRVFDYSVEPDKKYRYRLKVGVENPNYGLHPRFLKDPGAPENKEQIRLAKDWSEISSVVTIPAGYGVLAGSVEASRDPWAKVLLMAIKDDGVVAATEVRVQRGAVANKRERVEAIDPRDGSKQPAADVDFKTRMVVVDIFGGKLVSGPKRRTTSPIAAPGEVLLLDTGGNLVVHNDLEDLDDYVYRLPPKVEEKASEDDKPAKKETGKGKGGGDDELPGSKRKAGNSTTKAGR